MYLRKSILKLKHKTRIRTRLKKISSSISKFLLYRIKTLHYFLENIYASIFGKYHKKVILMIIGVQRSGTFAMFANLSKDKRIKAYNEFSELSINGDEKLRLHPYPLVKKEINKTIILLKPLVETQNTLELF